MKELKEITLNENFIKGEGVEKQIEGFQQIYKDDLINKNKITKKLKQLLHVVMVPLEYLPLKF